MSCTRLVKRALTKDARAAQRKIDREEDTQIQREIWRNQQAYRIARRRRSAR